MIADQWLKELDVQCADVVASYKGLYEHMDRLDTAYTIPDEELEELRAVVAVKVNRMHMNIAMSALIKPEPKEIDEPVN